MEKGTHFFHKFIVVEENADGCLELVEFKLLEKYFRLVKVMMLILLTPDFSLIAPFLAKGNVLIVSIIVVRGKSLQIRQIIW